jgi:DNA repair exonuclease SbcCD ATPase subunit
VASAREAVYRQRDVIAVNKSKLQEVRGSIQSYELTLERERDQEDNFHAMEQSILDSCLLWIATKRKLEAQEILVAEAQGAVLEKTQVVETLTQARQLYLKNFLGQINATARSYLEHIGAKAMVELVPVGDRGLELQTVGTGADSYANCSGGEQRRIDFCLALAMAEVAAGMGHLTRDVPLVVDEAFDTLDEAGITALLSLACHIAKRRQVILVSHVLPDVPLESSIVPIRLGP